MQPLNSADILAIRSRFVQFLAQFITWVLRKREVARSPNQQSVFSFVKKYTVTCSHAVKLIPKYEDWTKNVAFRREILKITHFGNSAAAHARQVVPFSVTNELGLENHLSYLCTKFGENR